MNRITVIFRAGTFDLAWSDGDERAIAGILRDWVNADDIHFTVLHSAAMIDEMARAADTYIIEMLEKMKGY
jgi:hypothetical protein